jgi:hypothetical protein
MFKTDDFGPATIRQAATGAHDRPSANAKKATVCA